MLTNLIAGTTYTFQVSAYDASGNESILSNSISVSTQDTTVSYCSSKGNTTNYEYIDYVGIGGISNSTGANGGYADFTSQAATLSYGANTIVLSVGFVSSSYTEHWSVWIDFNKNGVFETSEKMVSGSTASSGNLSYDFNIPSSALSGKTRMRVSMKWNSSSNPCETFGYGEVRRLYCEYWSAWHKNKRVFFCTDRWSIERREEYLCTKSLS